MEYAYDLSADPVLILRDQVLAHFGRHRQLKPYSVESGGQLFSRLASDIIEVERATGPRWSDRRGRRLFVPNRRAERKEIRRMYRTGLHFVGDWHSHPQSRPVPSARDIDSIRSEFELSEHELEFLVLVIVGTALPPEGLYVCSIGPSGIRELVAI